jgi:formylglycine-generating enzyme required for sulfatase activity
VKSRFSFGTDAAEKYVHQVSQKKSNPLGLSEIHGNVWEWCGDVSAEKLRGGTDPEVSTGGSSRVYRGGSWSFGVGDCRSTNRGGDAQGDWGTDLGFRLAMSQSAK